MKIVLHEIKEPCSQDWNKMKEVPGGRFCDFCNKKVHDLTDGHEVPNTTNICGRILQPKKISFRRALLRKHPVRYLLVLFVLLLNNIKAQAQKMAALNVDLQKDINDTTQRELVLSGIVVDSTTQEPLPYARGLVFDSQKKIIGGLNTDADGYFVFKFFHHTGTDTSVSLRVTREGYVPLELNDIPLWKKNTAVQVCLDTLLKPIGTPYAVGGALETVEVVITGTPVYVDLTEETADPEKFGRLHGVPHGLKTRMDNSKDDR